MRGECRSAYLVEPLRQVDMKALRSSPFRFLAAACLLQAVIFSCCVILAGAAAGVPLRQDDINVLRSSPLRLFAVACALQSFIFCCCAACAALGCLVSCATADTAISDSRTRVSTNEILRCSMGSPLWVWIDLGCPGGRPPTAPRFYNDKRRLARMKCSAERSG